MPKFTVYVERSVECSVEVEAADEHEAYSLVDKADFPLPPAEEWEPIEGWRYVVQDADGRELLDVDR